MCPVHTPDGSPCGLLNHLTHGCAVVAADPPDAEAVARELEALLAGMGMARASAAAPPRPPLWLPVSLDGRVLGHVRAARAAAVVAELRAIKAHNLARDLGRAADPSAWPHAARVPAHLEVCLLPHERGGPYAGLLLFSQQARVARAVAQLPGGAVELLGSLEQANMHIR